MRAVPPLIEALKDSEWKVRRAAAEALGYFSAAGRKSHQPLLDCLGDERTEVRRAVILSLGRLGKGSPQVEAAVRHLLEDSDPVAKINARVALALMGKSDDSAIPALVGALGSKEDATARASGLALSNMGTESQEKLVPSLIEALNSSEEPLVSNTLKVLRQMKGQAPRILPEVAEKYEKVDPKNRLAVLKTANELDDTGEYALSICLKALEDKDPIVRKGALMGALRYRSRLNDFMEQFVKCLQDSEEENRLLAIGIVKGLGNKAVPAIPSLIALAKEGTPRVRVSALSSLGAFTPPSEEVIGVLDTGLKDSDEKVKMAALSTLRTVGQSNPGAVIPILEKTLEAEKEQTTKRSIVAVLDSLKKTGQGTGSR
jgi:HEAT repeat protein